MSKQKLITVAGLVAAVAAATAGQIGALDAKAALYVTMIGAVFAAVGGAISKFLEANIYVTLTGVGVAVFGVLMGAGDLIGTKWAQIAGIAGAALTAMGKSLFGWDDDSSGQSASRGGVSFLLAGALLFGAMTQTACWGGGQATRARRIIEQLDNNAIAARESQLALGQLVALKLIQPATAQGVGAKVETFRAANKQLIEFFDQPGFKAVDADGKVTITLTPANKEQARTLVNGLITAGQAIVADQSLFPRLSPESRAAFSALIAAAGTTAQSLLDLVNSLKATNKATAISIPAADWQLFQHAKEVQFGY